MSAPSGYTDDETKKAFSDCFNFVSNKQKEAEAAKKKFDETYRKWKLTRKKTIRRTGEIAERIKEMNDSAIPVQTICRGIGMGGKIAALCGPAAAVVGAGVSLVANVGYAACSTNKVVQLEEMCKDVQRMLEMDTRKTQNLLRLLNEIRTISKAVKECVKTFHSATVKGFFDSLPELQCFTAAVKSIQSIDDTDGFVKFLTALWDVAEYLSQDSQFRCSFSALTAYNSGIMELIVTIPKIILDCTVIYTALSDGASPIGTVMKGLMVATMISDFEDIVRKLCELNEYPKLSKNLLEIKKKLTEERDDLSKLAMEMDKKTT